MSNEKLSSDIKTVLDGLEPSAKIKRQLHSRRVQILDQAEEKARPWSHNWLLAVATTAVILLAIVLVIPNGLVSLRGKKVRA